MLTFSPLGGTSIRLEHGKQSIVLFGDRKKPDSAAFYTLYDTPDEEPAAGTISWPGEYDVEGIAVLGIGHQEGKYVSYALDVDGVRCAFLASPLRDWTDHELELLGDVDILFIPTDDPKIVQKLVDEIDPRVLVPLQTAGDGEKYAEALKICGAQDKEAVGEYKVKGGLPAEGREVVVLK